MQFWKRLLSFAGSAALALGTMTACGTAAPTGSVSDSTAGETSETEQTTEPEKTREAVISLDSIAETLGAGWNLGNTLEAISSGHVSETAWGNPAASQEIMDLVAAQGFTTVRVPVSYIDKIDDANATRSIPRGWTVSRRSWVTATTPI